MSGIYGFNGEFRFLSNFWPVPIEFDDDLYPSVEHAYQASKTLDLEERHAIKMASAPGFAKRTGKYVHVCKDWEFIKLDIMRELQRQKYGYATHESNALAIQLLATGDCYIEETNKWGDTFWGVCKGIGRNHLGHILMTRRTELKRTILT